MLHFRVIGSCSPFFRVTLMVYSQFHAHSCTGLKFFSSILDWVEAGVVYSVRVWGGNFQDLRVQLYIHVDEECLIVWLSVQIERVKIAVVSLQQRAAMFDVRWSQGDIAGKGKDSQQEDSEGSIWSNEACLSELLCLLPIVTSRCPSLLTPGD